MKKLEFETSKGRFVLVDNNQDDENVIDFLKKIDYGSYMNRIKLSEITEEQASEIVDDSFNAYNEHSFKYYGDKIVSGSYIVTAIESLNSLLESKGVHLFEKPYIPEEYLIDDEALRYDREAEEKTFYNPYIFKL